MSSLDSFDAKQAFFYQQPQVEGLLNLFEFIPGAHLYVKDRESRFVAVNQQLLSIYDARSVEDVIGHTDRDFHPAALAEAYIAEDRKVMESGEAISNRVWLVPHIRGMPQWFVSSKQPIRSQSGSIIGVAGVMYAITHSEQESRYFGQLTAGIRYLEQQHTKHATIAEAARLCGLSSTTFNRRFQEALKMTPTALLLAMRTETARRLLLTTTLTLGRIALDCGFSDQSHFTKRFKEATGTTPREYRTLHR